MISLVLASFGLVIIYSIIVDYTSFRWLAYWPIPDLYFIIMSDIEDNEFHIPKLNESDGDSDREVSNDILILLNLTRMIVTW